MPVRTGSQPTRDVPVPHVEKDSLDCVIDISQERSSKRILEQSVVVLLAHIMKETCVFPVLQIVHRGHRGGDPSCAS